MPEGVAEEFIIFLKRSNTAQLGSFGEALFFTACLGRKLTIERHFRERTDFMVENRRYDVKTTRRFLEQPSSSGQISIAKAQRAAGVFYVSVQFSMQGVLIATEGELFRRRGSRTRHKTTSVRMSWSRAERVYRQWRKGHSERRSTPRGLPPILKTRIEEIFQRHELEPPYILYRTNMFKGESPHNLLPSERSEGLQRGWTVLLIFDTMLTAAHLQSIIAFPDSAAQTFRILEKSRLGNVRKLDVSQISKRYICDTKKGEALLEDLDRRLPMP
jgi:hypothetical protein